MCMSDITLGEAWAWLLAAAAGLVSLAKAWDIVAARLKPQKELEKVVAEHSRQLVRDQERLDEQERANAVVFRALYALINHEISGNGDEILRKSRDEIQNYLTGR